MAKGLLTVVSPDLTETFPGARQSQSSIRTGSQTEQDSSPCEVFSGNQE